MFADQVKVSFDGGFDGGSCAEPIIERCVSGSKDSNIGGPQVEAGQLGRQQLLELIVRDLSAAKEELTRSFSRVCNRFSIKRLADGLRGRRHVHMRESEGGGPPAMKKPCDRIRENVLAVLVDGRGI